MADPYDPMYNPYPRQPYGLTGVSRPSYGPLNALSDIASAIIQRNQAANSPGLISNALNGIYNSTEQLHDPSQDGANINQAVMDNAVQSGLLPSLKSPTSANIGQGIMGGSGLPANYNPISNQIMPQASVGTQTLQGMSPQAPQGFTPQQSTPPAQNIGLPSPDLSQSGQGIQLPSTNFSTQQTAPTSADISNPMAQDDTAFKGNPIATKQPTSPLEAQQLITQSLLKAQGTLAQKGIPTSVSGPILAQAAKEKMDDYQNQFKQQQVQGLITRFNNPNTTPQEKAWIAAQAKAQLGIDVGAEAKNFMVDPTKQYEQGQENYRWATPSGNNTQTTGEKHYEWGVPSANNTQTTQTAKDVANINGNFGVQKATISANRPRGGGNGQPKQVKIQGKSGQVYTPAEIAQAKSDSEGYYQAQNSVSLELADDADMRKWNKAAFIVNDLQE